MTSRETSVALGFEYYIAPLPSRWRRSLRLARQNPVGTLSLVVVLGLLLSAVFAGQLAPYSPTAVATGLRLEGPSGEHLLGTDQLGRDVLSRMLYGARVSLRVSFLSVGIGTLAGAVIGMISGYFGGWLDLIVQRVMDIVMSIPAFLFALVIVAALGTSSTNVLIAIAVVLIPGTSRVMRAVVLQVRSRAYVEAASASGASGMRVIARHIVPNAIDEMLILASVALGAAIIIEAALSFLGLGAQPPEASWGKMLAEGRGVYEKGPHMVWIPSIVISVTVLAVNMLGDSVRDILDPKVRGGSETRF
jgi:peptide/nickel transport system permease protein